MQCFKSLPSSSGNAFLDVVLKAYVITREMHFNLMQLSKVCGLLLSQARLKYSYMFPSGHTIKHLTNSVVSIGGYLSSTRANIVWNIQTLFQI